MIGRKRQENWLLAIGGWRLAVGCWLLAIGYWLLAIGGWLLAVGCWLLAVGGWRLAVGGWRLAVGYWLLAVGVGRSKPLWRRSGIPWIGTPVGSESFCRVGVGCFLHPAYVTQKRKANS